MNYTTNRALKGRFYHQDDFSKEDSILILKYILRVFCPITFFLIKKDMFVQQAIFLNSPFETKLMSPGSKF